jgi:uncharacterized coiled-coil protein SlyX
MSEIKRLEKRIKRLERKIKNLEKELDKIKPMKVEYIVQGVLAGFMFKLLTDVFKEIEQKETSQKEEIK